MPMPTNPIDYGADGAYGAAPCTPPSHKRPKPSTAVAKLRFPPQMPVTYDRGGMSEGFLCG